MHPDENPGDAAGGTVLGFEKHMGCKMVMKPEAYVCIFMGVWSGVRKSEYE